MTALSESGLRERVRRRRHVAVEIARSAGILLRWLVIRSGQIERRRKTVGTIWEVGDGGLLEGGSLLVMRCR